MLRFPKSARLNRTPEFRLVKEKGEAFYGKLLILGCLKTGDDFEARIGVITTRRLGNAVTRNKIRRRCREIFRVARPQLRHGMWLTVIARKHAANAPFSALQQEWLRLGKKAAIFTDLNSST